MKIVVLDLKTGEISVEDIPIPKVKPNTLLVKTHYSAVSLGTEIRTIRFARRSLIGKARERPDLFKQVLESVKKGGLLETFTKVQERLNMPFPLGYSIAGEVVDVGEDVHDFAVGDKVACSGSEYAFHAEYNNIPEMMCVKIPSSVDLKEASFVAIGSIAIHGIRNSQVSFGETVAVIGLGLVGLITIQILKEIGVRPIGIDVDRRKIEIAKSLGIQYSFERNDPGIEEKILELTGGNGVDAVIITASTKSPDPINLAGRIARDKARIVMVGDVGTAFEREIYYQKELNLVVSRSYGPGRYDPTYEKQGIDYPIGYVRWTLRRNMEEYINLLAERKINMTKIITNIFRVEEAPKAYEKILKPDRNDLIIGIVFQYQNGKQKENLQRIKYLEETKKIRASTGKLQKVKIGVIGTGAHAIGVILPILKKFKNIEFIGVSSATGLSASHVARKYGFKYVTTDYYKIIDDPEINTVFILTRNSLHSKITIEALRQEKNVFVEKPLALTIDELNEVISTWKKSPSHLMVGFNRRYSSFTKEILEKTKNRQGKALALYRVNAEKLDPTHWVYDKREGGGRIVSELPHFIDYLIYTIGTIPTQITCKTIETKDTKAKRDNFITNIHFSDGSLGTILYTSQGSRFFPKEYYELHTEGMSIAIDDFKKISIRGDNIKIKRRKYLKREKGHANELQLFVNTITSGNDLSHETKTAFISTYISILANKSAAQGGQSINIEPTILEQIG